MNRLIPDPGKHRTHFYAHYANRVRRERPPYTVRPARVPLSETNREDAPGAEASLRMNLVEADLAPERELNEIVWRSVRGPDSVMPAPVRAAFVRPIEEAEADAEDEEQDQEPR